jgi:SAM-dependent methyltransferase
MKPRGNSAAILHGPQATLCVACRSALSPTAGVWLGTARLATCLVCRSWTYLPRPTLEAQFAIHSTADYFDHPYFTGRRQAGSVQMRRCRRIFASLSSVADVTELRGKRMLDVGCDTGLLSLAAAELFGVRPVGIEISPHAVEVAQRKGLEVHHSSVEHAPDIGHFWLITAVDIIEHAADPEAFMRSLATKLELGGVLYLQTPNHRSAIYQIGKLLCNLTGGRPASVFERLFPPQHVQYLSGEGLASLAGRCGLRVIKIERQRLSASDLAVPGLVRAGLMVTQMVDQIRDSGILTCAVLRK